MMSVVLAAVLCPATWMFLWQPKSHLEDEVSLVLQSTLQFKSDKLTSQYAKWAWEMNLKAIFIAPLRTKCAKQLMCWEGKTELE